MNLNDLMWRYYDLFCLQSAVASSVMVTSAATLVLSTDSQRKYAAVVNDSDTVIYLSLGDPAAAGEGIRLNSEGGSYEIGPFNLWRGAVWAIHSSSGEKSLSILSAV